MELKIGEIISKYRKIKGYTQERLGELVGVSGQAVSKWEKGGIPDTCLLPSIAKELGVSIDMLFGTERKISDYSKEEILDNLFDYCLNKAYCNNKNDEFFEFLFETVWTMQSAFFGHESRPILKDVIEKHRGVEQITSQVIKDEGTTYLSLVEGFPIFCTVWDTPEISRKLLSEKNFKEFFSLLGSEDGLKAVILTQSTAESSQYTADMMAHKI